MKDKYSITKKWERKIEDMIKKAEFKYSVILANEENKFKKNYEYLHVKIEKKKLSYIKKHEDKYRKSMLNEIRELEGKPKREYKTSVPKLNLLEFAMKIAQENARLRDTDANGNGECVSCHKHCERGELAGGHRYSRRFQNICLEEENINAQCHTCNFTTGPRGDTIAKEKINQQYDEEIDRRFGEGVAVKLAKKVREWFQGTSTKYDLEMKIPELIDKNDELWEGKNFYAPAKKWRNIWTRYKNRT